MSLEFRALLLFLVAGGVLLSLRRPKSRAFGSAGWTTAKKERDLLHRRGQPLPPGAVFLGETRRRRLALPGPIARQHGVIVGGSGTGKSRGYFLPNAAFASETSLVCTDPKGELWRYTSGYHSEAARFAPTEPEASHCFNFVPLCRDPRVSELCARAIVEAGNTSQTEQCWLDLETAFLSALFSHASTTAHPTPLTAYRLFTRKSQEALLEELLSSPSEGAREQAILFEQTSDRMKGSIVPVVAAKLQFLRDPRIARFTSASHYAPDFGELRRRPYAVYWCLREHDITRLRPLTSVFFTLLLDQLAGVDMKEGEGTPVLMLLDEFANIGVIPHYATTLSLARGRGISIWHGIQSLSQLEACYGKANAQTILTNCATKIALSGLDVETADYFSRSLGEETVVTRKRTLHRRWFLMQPTSSAHSLGEHKRPLLTADEVRRIGTEEAIVITGNRRPMLLPRFFYNAAPNPGVTSPLGEARAAPMPMLPAPRFYEPLEPPPLPEDLPLRLTVSQ